MRNVIIITLKLTLEGEYMGMYDTVRFDCPNCGGLLEIQNKAGYCRLDYFEERSVPPVIALSLEGRNIICDKCSQKFIISISTPFHRRWAMWLDADYEDT